MRWVTATPRAHGALRYRCPVSNSYVLVTDDAELAALARPEAHLRCPACGDVHLLTHALRSEGDYRRSGRAVARSRRLPALPPRAAIGGRGGIPLTPR